MLFAAVADIVTGNLSRFVCFTTIGTVPFDVDFLLGDIVACWGVVALRLIVLEQLLLCYRVVGPFLDAEQVKWTVTFGAAPDFVFGFHLTNA